MNLFLPFSSPIHFSYELTLIRNITQSGVRLSAVQCTVSALITSIPQRGVRLRAVSILQR